MPSNDFMSNRQKADLLTSAMSTMTPHEFSAKFAQASILPIAKQMIEKSFARGLFQIDKISGPAAIYQTKKRQTAVVIAKYGGAPTRIQAYPRLTVVPYYIVVKPEVELSDLLDAQFDAAADVLADAGAEMAVREDSEFLTLFDSVAARGVDGTTDFPAVSAGPGGTGKKLDQNNVIIQSSRTAPTGGVTGDPSAADILRVQGLLRALSYNPDTILLNPEGLGRLMAQDNFLRYLNIGNREVHETGMMRSMLGNRIVWSSLVQSQTAFVFDTKEFCRLVERESLTVKPEFYELRAKWLVYERVAPFVRNANAVIRINWFS